ncbi:MAG TPA: hypothetical protein VJQ82_14090 [Terriglobales bacterium]|nr:hypothetical protein [Terriglobales bacterium]
MTLAVILGLWCALTPWSATGSIMGTYQEAPAQESKPDTTKPSDQTAPAAAPAESNPEKTESTAPPTTAKPKKKTHKKKPAPAATDTPSKVVIRNGSTTDPTVKLTPADNQKQTSSQIQNVNQMLANIDANLKLIAGRTLDETQQDTVKQIKTYMDQARKALDSGDVEQGRNLAFKAHLLSDDLVKH